MAKATEYDLSCSQYRLSERATKGLTLAVGALAPVTARSWFRCFFQWDSPFHNGLALQRGATDAACIITAVLISASDTSAAISRYYQQKNIRDGSLCPALSDLFRITADVFFFQRSSDVDTAKVEMADG